MSDSTPLLCESCGYDLSGTDSDGLCGECGEAVMKSLPEKRTGSAWQNGGGPVCLVRTAGKVFSQPQKVWDEVRIDGRSSAGLLIACVVLAGLVFGVGIDSLVAMPLFAIGVGALSMVEYFGLRTFGRRRGWRVTRSVALTVVGHASVGWTVAAGLAAVGLHLGRSLDGGLIVPRVLWSLLGRAILEWALVLPIVGFIAGLLVFEVLVYVGIQRCRFANPPTATL